MVQSLLLLAGPITGLSYSEATEWRQHVADRLPDHIKAVSAIRDKHYLSGEASVNDVYEDYPLSSAKGITCRDHNDVKRCDMLFVNFLGAKTVSIGTVLEIGWAYAYRKPIIVVMEDDNIHHHGMIRESVDFIVSDLDQAIHISTSVLSNEVI